MISSIQQSSLATDDTTSVLINKTQYTFKVVLINPEGKFFIFRPENIKELIIDDTLDRYFISGTITIDNNFDALERPSDSQNTAAYSFRGDSRDIIRLEITPVLDTNITSNDNSKIKGLMTLSYDCAIYNIEETLGDAPSTKYRKLYFWDFYKQILSEKNVQFSTATNKINQTTSTGLAIQNLLKTTFNPKEGFNISFEVFDNGGTSIFFTSPADYKAEDCLEYLLNFHVSTKDNNYDRCILKINKYPKTWSLMSLKQYFSYAYIKGVHDQGGSLFLEKFMLGGGANNSQNASIAVTISRSPEIAIYFAENNTIENFSFLPPAGQNTQVELVNKIVHSYNNKDKSFAIDSADNDFENANNTYFENYVKGLKGFNGDNPKSNIIGNYIRTSRQNVQNIYSTSSDSKEQRLGIGRSDYIKNAVLLNNALTFRVKGATYREAGRFISIDRNNSLPDAVFDNKMLGIYLIVNVKHIFNGGDYFNDILCVKTYNFKDTGEMGQYL